MSAHDDSAPAPSTSIAVLGSQYGTCDGHSAFARETSPGSWQVKVHHPSNPAAGHDGWVLLGSGWPTLAAATAATGLI
ncbi:conserved hypothetical protein [Frankia canadensis]|uniref:Uncharacterized protein n=1 Tax=Frankia canadensis TaxID=1836972 RepID=A0A2I2KSB2_9ACTN|nr:hypothetical protein [Frankia canadensis]SNQ48557.1 conserved hypothetical protein [Frankia canadensis]SOU55847.1 conserved hypothetical protein [Frankia canadensis]